MKSHIYSVYLWINKTFNSNSTYPAINFTKNTVLILALKPDPQHMCNMYTDKWGWYLGNYQN